MLLDEDSARQLQGPQQNAVDGVTQVNLCGNTKLGGTSEQSDADRPTAALNRMQHWSCECREKGLFVASDKLSSNAPSSPAGWALR